MIIKKNTKLKIEHQRKGNFTGRLLKDFDTEKDEWVTVLALTNGGRLAVVGDEVTFRYSLAKVTVLFD
jgi:hypothetical protein